MKKLLLLAMALGVSGLAFAAEDDVARKQIEKIREGSFEKQYRINDLYVANNAKVVNSVTTATLRTTGNAVISGNLTLTGTGGSLPSANLTGNIAFARLTNALGTATVGPLALTTNITASGASLVPGSSLTAVNARNATNYFERKLIWTDTTMDSLTITNLEHTITAANLVAGPVFSLSAATDCTNLTIAAPGAANLGRPTTLVNGVGSNLILQAGSTINGAGTGITFEDQYDSVTLIGFDATHWLVVNKNLAD